MKEERKVISIRIDDILPNRFQPRIRFDEDAITELSISIKEHGVIQPIVVRPVGDKYEIIAGERRYKASVMAGLEEIPAVITKLDDKDSAEVALIENVQRQDLTPIEEAISYKKILDMGYLTQEQLAAKLGKSQSTIANKLRLLNLEDDVQDALLNESISERHARSLLRIENANQQLKMLNRIINERLTVRRADEEIDKMINGSNDEKVFGFDKPEEKKEDSKFIFDNDVPSIEPIDFGFGNREITDQPKENLFDSNIKEEDNTNFFGFNNYFDNNQSNEAKKDDLIDFNTLLSDKNNNANLSIEEETTIKPGKFFNMFDDKLESPEVESVEGVNANVSATPNPEVESFEEENNDVSAAPNTEVNNSYNDLFNNSSYDLDNQNQSSSDPIQNDEQQFNQSEFNSFFNKEYNNDLPPIEELKSETIKEPEYEFNEFVPQSIELDNEEDEEVNNVNSTELVVTDAITKVKNCINELENLGFKVSFEEMDFENNYQIIVNINK